MIFPQNFKIKIAQVICHPLIGRFLGFLFRDHIPCRGLQIDTRASFINPVIKASLFWNLYESAELRFIEQYLRTDHDVIELGSSIGVTSCKIRRLLDKSCRLICVEANPELVQQIELNMLLNKISGDNVTIIPKGIRYHQSNHVDTFFTTGSSNIMGKIETRPAGVRRVETITLSEIIDKYQIDEFSMVCDIEGAEIGMIMEEKEVLRKCQQLIIELHEIENNDRHIDIREMKDLLVSKYGFHLVDQHGYVCTFER